MEDRTFAEENLRLMRYIAMASEMRILKVKTDMDSVCAKEGMGQVDLVDPLKGGTCVRYVVG